LGGILIIYILPFFKNSKKEIVGISFQTVGIVCLVITILLLIGIGIAYGLHKKIKIPKIIFDWVKKLFKRLYPVAIIVGIWWYWYPIKNWVLPTIKERPGVERKATTMDNSKEKTEVIQETKKEEKVSYYLRWEKPKDRRLRYINFPDGRCDVLSFEENNGCIKFTIRNPSKKNEDILYSLQPFNARESCGKWNGKDIYNTSEPVWEWKGVYTNHLGQVGNVYMNRDSSNKKTKYIGKIFLPNYPDKWINLVIYQ
jgi:hypothetical protein